MLKYLVVLVLCGFLGACATGDSRKNEVVIDRVSDCALPTHQLSQWRVCNVRLHTRSESVVGRLPTDFEADRHAELVCLAANYSRCRVRAK